MDVIQGLSADLQTFRFQLAPPDAGTMQALQSSVSVNEPDSCLDMCSQLAEVRLLKPACSAGAEALHG